MFHIGKITRHVGNAFACSDPKHWQETYTRSPSGLSVNNATAFYPFLINRDGEMNFLNKSKLHAIINDIPYVYFHRPAKRDRGPQQDYI